MHVSVAIVGFRNPQDIAACLAALGASTHTDFDVVICENGGPEAFQALVAVLPAAMPGGQAVRAVDGGDNLGFAGGVNRCLRESPDADAWWILNPDSEPEPGALAAKVGRLVCGDADAVGCTVYLSDGLVQSHGGRWMAWAARAESIGFGSRLEAGVDAGEIEARQNYINGAAMLVGRRFLEAAGPMREDYFLYCEEVEWCLRALQRGVKLGFAPKARVLHHQGTTTGAGGAVEARPRAPVYLGERNKVLLTRDRFPGLMPLVAFTAPLLAILRYGRRAAWRQLGTAFAGLAAGFRGERGAPAWMRRS